MAIRPLAFGIRFRESGRTLRLQHQARPRRRTEVVHERPGRHARRVEHTSLGSALEHFARLWRGRLH
jgi:hypothetical protein